MSIPGVGIKDLLQARSVRVVLGPRGGELNPSVKGEGSPAWPLFALTYWFFDTEQTENRPQSPWHSLKTKSERSGYKSNNISTKD